MRLLAIALYSCFDETTNANTDTNIDGNTNADIFSGASGDSALLFCSSICSAYYAYYAAYILHSSIHAPTLL